MQPICNFGFELKERRSRPRLCRLRVMLSEPRWRDRLQAPGFVASQQTVMTLGPLPFGSEVLALKP